MIKKCPLGILIISLLFSLTLAGCDILSNLQDETNRPPILISAVLTGNILTLTWSEPVFYTGEFGGFSVSGNNNLNNINQNIDDPEGNGTTWIFSNINIGATSIHYDSTIVQDFNGNALEPFKNKEITIQ